MTDRTPARIGLAAIAAAALLVLTACGSTGTAGPAAGGGATVDSVSVSTAGASPGGNSSDDATSAGGPSSSGASAGPASNVPAVSEPAIGVPSSASSSSSSGAPTTTSASSAPSTPTGSVSGGVVAPDGVRGYQFIAKAATGRDLAPGKPIALTVPAAGGTISINAGCNAMGGKPTWTGSRLTVAPGISTMMACMDPGGGNQRMVQEHWLTQWLSKGVDWKLTGSDLVLSADGVTIVFVRAGSPQSHPAVPSAHPPLVNTKRVTSGSVSTTSGTARPSQAHPAPVVGPTSLASGVTAPAKSLLPGDSINPPPTTDH